MSVGVRIVMDPIASISYKKDSSLAMLLAAQKRGWELFYMEQRDLYQAEGQARARMRAAASVRQPGKMVANSSAAELAAERSACDPDAQGSTVRHGVRLLHLSAGTGRKRSACWWSTSRRACASCNEKLFATLFPQCTPPTIVSRRPDVLREFADHHGDVILKPLDGMGGSSIFRHTAGHPNLSVILETLTLHGQQQIMIQGYLPAIVDGDKRILMIDGEPVGFCLARIPAAGETRGNLAAGGRGEARPLTDKDRWIAAQVGPTLREKGLLFVGLDVIGEHLTEINVTSPTCIREIDNAFGTDIGGMLMDAIDQKLKAR